MKEKEPKSKRGRGRPRIYVMPEPIHDTPENIARVCMQGQPAKDWDFLKPGSGAKVEKK